MYSYSFYFNFLFLFLCSAEVLSAQYIPDTTVNPREDLSNALPEVEQDLETPEVAQDPTPSAKVTSDPIPSVVVDESENEIKEIIKSAPNDEFTSTTSPPSQTPEASSQLESTPDAAVDIQAENELLLRTTPLRPMITNLEGVVRDNEILLTWDSYPGDEEINISYSIYRSSEPIRSSTFNIAEHIAYVRNGSTQFVDRPILPGDYYYAIFVNIANNEVPVFREENTLTVPVHYLGNRDNLKQLYGLETWSDVQISEEKLDSSTSDTLLAVQPITSKQASPVISKQASPVISKQASPVISKQASPVISEKPSPVISSTGKNGSGTPNVNVYITIPEIKGNNPVLASPNVEETRNVNKKDTKEEEKKRAARRRREEILYPDIVIEILNEEKKKPKNEYEHRLQWILYELLAKKDWQKALDELLYLLQYYGEYSPLLGARIAFYRGQIFHVFSKNDNAILEFYSVMQVKEYEKDAIRWIQKIKAKR